MHSLQFTAESSANGMVERDFIVGGVTGVLWSPVSGAADRAPLVLMAHGGGNHKKHPAMSGRARLLVTGCGLHVAVIDAPGHGDRPRTTHDEAEIAELFRARAAGEPEGPIVVRYNAHLAELAVPEYQASLDALQELPQIGTDGPVGFWGLNMGTAIGVPFVANEPRITAAVFGQHWPDVLAEKAKQITIPIEFDLQWDDEHISREEGLALFDAFASKEKSLHVNSGKHKELPRFEADSAVRFFARHFGRLITHDPSETPDASDLAGSQERPPSCRDLVGLLTQNDRRSAYAALVLGATTLEQVAERTGLRPAAAAMALQKLAEGGVVRHDSAQGTYVLLDDAFRLAVREEVRLTGRGGGDGAGAYFRKGRLTSIPGNAQVRNRVLSVVADSFEKGVTYPESKVNAICGGWLDDWVSLRRALVDEGLLRRDAAAQYERV